jgi:hypothetical protein
MGEKIREVTKYLYGCLTTEKEISPLYITATTKLPCPQLSAITLSIAYDNQKHAAVLLELLKPLLHISISKNELSKEFKIGFCEISNLHNRLIMEKNMDYEEVDKLLKDLTNLEDYLNDLYTNFIDSKLIENYSNGFLDEPILTGENLVYILRTLKQDNLKHRSMLIDSFDFFKKTLPKNKDATAKFRYQNPDAWEQTIV